MEIPQSRQKISIIIPVFNTQDFLHRCLQSLIMQTYCHWEAILIDDGSTDKSGEICDTYANEDARFQVIHQMNKGVSAARNAGINVATGKYISFVDSDDYMEPDMLRKMLMWIKEAGAEIAACGYYVKRSNRISTPAKQTKKKVLSTEETLVALMHRSYFQGFLCNKLFDCKIFYNGTSYDFFDINTSICEDLLFLSQCIAKGAKLVYYNEPLYWYCIREQSLMQSFSAARNNELYARKKIIDCVQNSYPRALRMAQSKYSEAAVNLLYYAKINEDTNAINYYKTEAKKYLKVYMKNKDILIFEKIRMYLKLLLPRFSIFIAKIHHARTGSCS